MNKFALFSVFVAVAMLFEHGDNGLTPAMEDRIARMVCAEACNQPTRTQRSIAFIIMSAAVNAGKALDEATSLQSGYYLSSWAAALNKNPHMSRIYFGEQLPYQDRTLSSVRDAYGILIRGGATPIFHFDDCSQTKPFEVIYGSRIKWKNGMVSFKVDENATMCMFSKTIEGMTEFTERIGD